MNVFSILLTNNLCNLEVVTAANYNVQDIITFISFVMDIEVLRLIAK